MIRRPPRSTRTDTLFPYTALFRSIGKIAAATTTAILIEKFNVAEIVFAGLAGGIHPSVQTGDIVVASSLMQHDLDARPLFKRYEVPMLGLRSEEHTSELQSLMRISYAVFCLKNKQKVNKTYNSI